MHREQSGNPFGDNDGNELDPRGFSVNLDKDTLYSSWFQLADAGERVVHACGIAQCITTCCYHTTCSIYCKLFATHDCDSWLPDHDNKLTGPDAVKFFERSQLPRPVLAKVWALADSARKGYLDPGTFAKVIPFLQL